MTAADLSGRDQLPWPCEFTCMGCGRKARGEFANHHWFKPRSWFERSDADGPQTVCSHECIDRVSKKTGETGVVIPL